MAFHSCLRSPRERASPLRRTASQDQVLFKLTCCSPTNTVTVLQKRCRCPPTRPAFNPAGLQPSRPPSIYSNETPRLTPSPGLHISHLRAAPPVQVDDEAQCLRIDAHVTTPHPPPPRPPSDPPDVSGRAAGDAIRCLSGTRGHLFALRVRGTRKHGRGVRCTCRPSVMLNVRVAETQ